MMGLSVEEKLSKEDDRPKMSLKTQEANVNTTTFTLVFNCKARYLISYTSASLIQYWVFVFEWPNWAKTRLLVF